MTIAPAQEATRHSYPPKLRTLTVTHIEDLSPTMRRITVTGPDLERELPVLPLTTTTHVKIVIPQADGEVVLPALGTRGLSASDGVELFIRDYTIRAFDAAARILLLDFVLHEHGPAGRWAITATPGDRLGVLGPRGYTVYPDGYARYVLGADETALPALERWIEEAPQDARLDAFVLAPEGRRTLPAHPGLTVGWIEKGGADSLTAAVAATTGDDDGRTFVWAAAESGIVAPLRRHLTGAGSPRTAFDITGYWRLGRVGSGSHDETETQA